jgi:4-amino-4-deoxy-L-arabinose transferase-like glycosyltransferase
MIFCNKISSKVILGFVAVALLLVFFPKFGHPISEGHRNAQTAALTAGMLENGTLRLDPIAPWRGDLDARLVQELPIFNLTALALHAALPFLTLDSAGRLASLLFWAAAFLLVQTLWKRTLPPPAIFWANLLFLLCPMNLYLATAFMPETLLLLLTIAFLLLLWDYADAPSLAKLSAISAISALGLLVKFPAFVHLALVAILLLTDRQGWKFLFRPAHLLAATLLLAMVFGWGKYVEAVNKDHFASWSGMENLLGFIRPEASRISPGYWLTLIAYNLSFILPFAIAWLAFPGAIATFKTLKTNPTSRFWLYNLIALFAFWTLWGKAAPAQNYYNLPNLILLSALFGLGCQSALAWLKTKNLPPILQKAAAATIALLLALSGYAGQHYLSRPDSITLAAAEWVKANTQTTDLIIYQPRHDPRVIDYEHQPLLSHLTGRRTWIWTRIVPELERQRALETSSYLIVTNPAANTSQLETLRRKFKGAPPPPPEPVFESHSDQAAAWPTVFETSHFIIKEIQHPSESFY